MEIKDTRDPVVFQELVEMIKRHTEDILCLPKDLIPQDQLREQIGWITDGIFKEKFAFVYGLQLIKAFKSAYTVISRDVLEIIASIIKPRLAELEKISEGFEKELNPILELKEEVEEPLELTEEIGEPAAKISPEDFREFFGAASEVNPSEIQLPGPLTQVERSSIPLEVREDISFLFADQRDLKRQISELFRNYGILHGFAEDLYALKGVEAKAILLNGQLKQLKLNEGVIQEVGTSANSLIKRLQPVRKVVKDDLEWLRGKINKIQVSGIGQEKKEKGWLEKTLKGAADQKAEKEKRLNSLDRVLCQLQEIARHTAEFEAVLIESERKKKKSI
jgi:hypothetical protein